LDSKVITDLSFPISTVLFPLNHPEKSRKHVPLFLDLKRYLGKRDPVSRSQNKALKYQHVDTKVMLKHKENRYGHLK
jgi:hypothetical protein